MNFEEIRTALYGFEHRLTSVRQAIANSNAILPENKVDLLAFLQRLEAQGRSKSRVVKYAYGGKLLAQLAPKPFRDMDVADVERLVLAIDQQATNQQGQPLTAHSRRDLKIALKLLFQVIRNSGDNYPVEVAWIRAKSKDTKLQPEALLSEDEIKAMIAACTDDRDKALIATVYYSNCRIGEILTLTSDNVHDKGTHYVLAVDGKTGARRVPLAEGKEYLKRWLENHPARAVPSYPIFVSDYHRASGDFKPLLYPAARKILQEAAVKAGITKRVHPHLFRHSRSTELAALGMNESTLNSLSGWEQGSRMPGVYLSLSSTQIEDSLLQVMAKKKAAGVKEDEAIEELIGMAMEDEKTAVKVLAVLADFFKEKKKAIRPLLAKVAVMPNAPTLANLSRCSCRNTLKICKSQEHKRIIARIPPRGGFKL